VSSFSKLQTCIQINKNIKVKKKHFIFIIQNNNINRKHIKKRKEKVSRKVSQRKAFLSQFVYHCTHLSELPAGWHPWHAAA
jgi:hypothetical protein